MDIFWNNVLCNLAWKQNEKQVLFHEETTWLIDFQLAVEHGSLKVECLHTLFRLTSVTAPRSSALQHRPS